MILVDETKLNNGVLYDIISANSQNIMKEEFKIKYNSEWLELRHKTLEALEGYEDKEKIMKMWDISGEGVDYKAYVDYHLHSFCMYDNIEEVEEGLVSILKEIKNISKDTYESIIKKLD